MDVFCIPGSLKRIEDKFDKNFHSWSLCYFIAQSNITIECSTIASATVSASRLGIEVAFYSSQL